MRRKVDRDESIERHQTQTGDEKQVEVPPLDHGLEQGHILTLPRQLFELKGLVPVAHWQLRCVWENHFAQLTLNECGLGTDCRPFQFHLALQSIYGASQPASHSQQITLNPLLIRRLLTNKRRRAKRHSLIR